MNQANTKMMKKHAIISPCGKYRYTLERIWEKEKPLLLFIMLNPSTADATEDDNTIRRCIGFAKSNGYGGILIGNLYAYRATKPRLLFNIRSIPFITGPDNDEHICTMAERAKDIVFAWGNHGQKYSMGDRVAKRMSLAFNQPLCLGVNANGHPKHPLYVSSNVEFVKFPGLK